MSAIATANIFRMIDLLPASADDSNSAEEHRQPK
jgi:hypothetical protein